MKNNNLHESKSNYLQLNKESRIHWQEYTQETVSNAKSQNKPIIVSIGSTTSPWARLMDSETYTHPGIIENINNNFFAIKVDRDEFPELHYFFLKTAATLGKSTNDIDMCVNAFLFNDFSPFNVTFYHPTLADENFLGFLDLIQEMHERFQQKNEELKKTSQDILSVIQNPIAPQQKIQFEGHFPQAESIMKVVSQFEDKQNLGYGSYPKKINYPFYEWAVEQILEGMISKEHGEFIIKTLEKSLFSPMYDHCRGGVHHLCYDDKWSVPNFQKKLSDQAAFLKLMAKLSLIYPAPIVFDSIYDTLKYLKDEMLYENDDSKNSAYFFNAQDGFSEGIEGLYYLFSQEEFEDAIAKHDSEDEELLKNIDRFKKWFSIESNGNIQNGLNAIKLNLNFKDEIYLQENWELIRKCKKALAKERRRRLPPMTDSVGLACDNFNLLSSFVDIIQYVRIEPIKKMAYDLVNLSLDGIYFNFIIKEENKFRLKHSTSTTQKTSYSEDLISFAECQIRLFEVSANSVFKQNFLDALNTINDYFIEDSNLKIKYFDRNTSGDLTNINIEPFDFVKKSPLSMYVNLCLKADNLNSSSILKDRIKKVIDDLKQSSLSNPIMSGEALRALIYPDNAYRRLKIPSSWINEPKYLQALPFFLNRFVLDYHAEKENWEILNSAAVEKSGSGIEEFIKIFSQNQTES